MSMDDNDGQMIFGDLKLPDICLTGEEKPRKNLTQETYPDRGSNPGPLRDKRACNHLLHSGGNQGLNRCGSFPLLSVPHSLFSIWTDLKRSKKIPGTPTWRWGECIWLTGPSGLHRYSLQGVNGFWPDQRSGNPNHPSPPIRRKSNIKKNMYLPVSFKEMLISSHSKHFWHRLMKLSIFLLIFLRNFIYSLMDASLKFL